MRSLPKPALAAALAIGLGLPAAPLASADDLVTGSIVDAFDLNQTDSSVSEVAYMSDCCGDAACGDDLGCCDECGDGCGGGVCGCPTCKKKAPKPNPCATSHKGLYFLNDFSYLNDPCYRGDCLGDCLKQLDTCVCGPGKVDIGGQLRFRYHSEQSLGFPGQLGFSGTDEDFLLTRLRLFTNWKINDWARFYVEGIFAENSDNGSFVPRPIDRNYGDFQNLFFDVKLTEGLTFRVGRQEHLYGAQRLLSPLDWANTRQKFEGLKLLYKQGDWAIDAFWTVFVPNVPNKLDEGDYNRRIYGTYATYTGAKSANYDMYYIGFDDTRAGSGIVNDFSLHTLGGRLWGGQGDWLYECEGGYQFGRQSGLGVDHRASFYTVGLGKKLGFWQKWAPTLWFYYDFASGNDADGGTFNRFNQLFPLAHKYLGFADFAQRANISSPNVLLTMKPTSKINFLLWYYYLGAADEEDIVPGVATLTAPNGAVAPAGLQNATSEDFAHELDLIMKYTFGPRSNILFGYSNVYAGDKIVNPLDSDANFFYTQWELNF